MFVATFFRSKAAALAQAGGEGAPAKVVRRRRAPKTPAATVNGSDIFVKACITTCGRDHIGPCHNGKVQRSRSNSGKCKNFSWNYVLNRVPVNATCVE